MPSAAAASGRNNACPARSIDRHFLKLDAFASASDTDIARVARPWVTTGVDPSSE
jgi:hypothetical protein